MTERARRTMADVQRIIGDRVDELSKHPLFAKLDASSDIDDLRAIAPQGYFFIHGFQDILRLTHARIEDPHMKQLALSLKRDDAGHDEWFRGDMEVLGTVRDAEWVFGPEHQRVRDIVYGLVSELLRAQRDSVRLVTPLILEGCATLFFASMIGVSRRAGFASRLRYFAPMHEEAEQSHDVFNEAGQDEMLGVEFDEAALAEAMATIERAFGCFAQLVELLDERVSAARAGI